MAGYGSIVSMKKVLLVIILIIMLVMGLAPTIFAAEKPSISIDKTAIEENTPGILPTNPFYFVKEWGRGVKRIITLNPVSRADFELRVASHKAAELRKIQELDPTNAKAMKVAFENYSEDVLRLRVHLITLRDENKASDLLVKINEEIAAHEEIKARILTQE